MATILGQTFEDLLASLRMLPGVGPRSAQRIALSLLNQDRQKGLKLAQHLESALTTIQHCERCAFFTDNEQGVCHLCSDPHRSITQLCVVESASDVITLEQTGQYTGLYFVLHGRLSPIDGIDAQSLRLPKLFERLAHEAVEELIIATNNTVDGDATAFYIVNQLKNWPGRCSRIACGIPMDGEIEYLNSKTLCYALRARTPLDLESD